MDTNGNGAKRAEYAFLAEWHEKGRKLQGFIYTNKVRLLTMNDHGLVWCVGNAVAAIAAGKVGDIGEMTDRIRILQQEPHHWTEEQAFAHLLEIDVGLLRALEENCDEKIVSVIPDIMSACLSYDRSCRFKD